MPVFVPKTKVVGSNMACSSGNIDLNRRGSYIDNLLSKSPNNVNLTGDLDSLGEGPNSGYFGRKQLEKCCF